MKEAPVYADALRLCTWISLNLPAQSPLGARVHHRALDLLEHVTLALHGQDREDSLIAADRTAAVLRALLRLCHDTGLLDEGQALHVAGILDSIGRQIGGWLRRLEGDTGPERRR